MYIKPPNEVDCGTDGGLPGCAGNSSSTVMPEQAVQRRLQRPRWLHRLLQMGLQQGLLQMVSLHTESCRTTHTLLCLLVEAPNTVSLLLVQGRHPCVLLPGAHMHPGRQDLLCAHPGQFPGPTHHHRLPLPQLAGPCTASAAGGAAARAAHADHAPAPTIPNTLPPLLLPAAALGVHQPKASC